MGISVADNFSYLGGKPLDGRIQYATLAAMKSMADATLYEGCEAYCVATDKYYKWKSSNTVDADTGKWREVSSGGGSIPVATANTLGGIKVGSGLSITQDGTLSTVDSPVYAGLGNVANVRLTGDNSTGLMQLNWNDPDDVVISGGGYYAQWVATVVVKNDNHPPHSPSDGTVICTNYVRNSYDLSNTLVDHVTPGSTSYYRFFPLSGAGVYTYGTVRPSIVVDSFATISISDLSDLLTMHYDGEIDLSQVWNVGDTRQVELPTMTSTPANLQAQTAEMLILGFNHDDLTTPISTRSKAALSIAIKPDSSKFYYGYIDTASTVWWKDSYRRTWLNGTFYDAVPAGIQSLIKSVEKLSNADNTNIEPTTDKCWMMSLMEMRGSGPAEGEQYAYTGIISDSYYYAWTRSRQWGGSKYVAVELSGNLQAYTTNTECGIVPCFCL